jgi:dienelactone hydrolase
MKCHVEKSRWVPSMKVIALLFVAGLAMFVRHANASEPIPLADFIKSPSYRIAKLSPLGDYIGVIAERGENDVLDILDANTLKTVRVQQAPPNYSVGTFHWIGPKRLMLATNVKLGRRLSPRNSGHWLAVNVDGSSLQELNKIDHANDEFTDTNATKQANIINGLLTLQDTVPEDETRIVVSTVEYPEKGARAMLVNLNTFTGHYELITYAPSENCQFVMNKLHQPTYALCSERPNKDDDEVFRTQFYKCIENGKWLPVGKSLTSKSITRLLAESGDGRISATNNDGVSPKSFGFINASTGEYEPAYQDKVADVLETIIASDGVTVLGVVTAAATPVITMLDSGNGDAALYESIAGTFPKQFVNFEDATIDGKKILLSVRSEKNPGELYLYERDAKQARLLLRKRDWLKESDLSEVKSLKIKSRDGIDLYGYLTLPNEKTFTKPFPLIVNPHGGPIGLRDEWGFNWNAQVFASRGYAVLQVNFRGSGGYGGEFQKMGHMQWGGKIQDDIIDATRWVAAQGYVDTDRICIFGASFGAYSALMAPIREPGMFKCAVGYVGIYDMELMDSTRNASMVQRGATFIEENLGRDKAELRAISPVHNADKIKIPVFLAAGARDTRAPPIHTERMQAALKKAGNPAEEVIIQADEMHGFYDAKNALEFYTKILAFIEKYIGKK